MHKDAKSALQASRSALFDRLHDLHHRDIKIAKWKVALFNETIHIGKWVLVGASSVGTFEIMIDW